MARHFRCSPGISLAPQRTFSVSRQPLGVSLTCREEKDQYGRRFRGVVNGSFEDLQMQEAPFSFAVAHELRFRQLPHRDPGDRIIVATARIYDMTLVTADQNLIGLANLAVLPNL
jgi:PIN domain nuclease of toxin-antitoxin system